MDFVGHSISISKSMDYGFMDFKSIKSIIHNPSGPTGCSIVSCQLLFSNFHYFLFVLVAINKLVLGFSTASLQFSFSST